MAEFKEQVATDTSNWNSLLRWHRRSRGPQWDYSTGMYHVDLGSKEYYAGVERLEETAAPKDEMDVDAQEGGVAEAGSADEQDDETGSQQNDQDRDQSQGASVNDGAAAQSHGSPGSAATPSLANTMPPQHQQQYPPQQQYTQQQYPHQDQDNRRGSGSGS